MLAIVSLYIQILQQNKDLPCCLITQVHIDTWVHGKEQFNIHEAYSRTLAVLGPQSTLLLQRVIFTIIKYHESIQRSLTSILQ